MTKKKVTIEMYIPDDGTMPEIGIRIMSEDGSDLKPQQILDAVTEMLLHKFKHLPPPKPIKHLDS